MVHRPANPKTAAVSYCTAISQQSTILLALQSEMEDLCFAVLHPKAAVPCCCFAGLQPSTVSSALQSEMEDLCFAVLQPKDYRSLRQQLDRLWGTQSFPDLSRVLEAAFGGGQQTERVIKQLAGRRESPQELALRVAYSSNAVNAAKLLAPRKVRHPCFWDEVQSMACITGCECTTLAAAICLLAWAPRSP